MRGFNLGALLVFLKGASGSAGGPLPSVTLPPEAGDQPPSEKAKGFPPILGFHVEQLGEADAVFGIQANG